MRKSVLAAIGAASLALSSAASAAVAVTSSTNLTDPNPMAPTSIDTVGNTTTITFGQNPVGPGSFTSSFVFTNTATGAYYFLIGSSTPGLLFSDVTLVGGGSTWTLAPPAAHVLTLDNVTLLANTNYTLSMTGSTELAGAINGNITILPVPEPATWAMMLLGFAGMGLVIRRRREPALAQIA